MSADATDAASASTAGNDSEDPPTEAPADGASLFGHDLTSALQGGALAVAVVFALVAAVGFYTSARRVIDVWVAHPYRPVFEMGFNLVVLLVMIALVATLAKRLSE